MYDFLWGRPEAVAVLLSVELCSLTLQREDLSVANLIATGLFADGAAAVVAVGGGRGEARHGPRILDTRSVFFPGTQHIMGWDVGASGFNVVLSAELPSLIAERLRPSVQSFLDEHGLTLGDIDVWICHPGGPKVLEATAEALGLGPTALELSWRSLAEVGNLSSASVLLVLERAMERRGPHGSGHAVLMAMGPGFCAELVLLRW